MKLTLNDRQAVYRTTEDTKDMPVGTLIFNADHNVIVLKTAEDRWEIFYHNPTDDLDNDEVNAEDSADQIVGKVDLSSRETSTP